MNLPQDTHHTESIPHLQQAFDFVEKDLLANRFGQLTERQYLRLRIYQRRIVQTSLLIAFMLFVLILGGVVMAFFIPESIIIFCWLIWVIIIAILKSHVPLSHVFSQLESDLYHHNQKVFDKDFVVKDVVGIAYLRNYETILSDKVRLLCVGDYQFPINTAQSRAIYAGFAYRIYFLNEQFILSIEPTNRIDKKFRTASLDYPPRETKTPLT